jgi:hypothetical protein
MRKLASSFAVVMVALLGCGALATAQETIPNWTAPASWSPPGRLVTKGEISPSDVEAVEAVPTSPLHFVGITPCRVADTRGNGFTGQYGPPALTPSGRDMVIAGQCGIPVDAQAVSFNFTAVNVTAAGFLVAYPAGGAFPPVATMVYNQNTPNLSNAAVVPLGTGGAITVVAAVTTIDLVVDVNGYYRPGVVTAVNGLSGNVTLAAGSNVTITPSGQTLTVAATGGAGGVLPTGTSGQTLRHDGSSWVANSALTNDGTDVALTGTLDLPSPLLITEGGSRFLHTGTDPGSENTFLGGLAGNLAMTGGEDTGIGYQAMSSNTFGFANTAVGVRSLLFNTTGNFNTALGRNALKATNGGDWNTAVGSGAMEFNGTGDQNTAVGNAALANGGSGNHNTAVGASAMGANFSGSTNTALGSHALSANYSGGSNIAIGADAGSILSTGSNNIYIGNSGSTSGETGQIRIGTVANITSGTVIVGISGFGSSGGIPVIVNGGGRLGTTTSSARFKEDVHNIDSESDGLMKLRPVAFRYKESHEPGRLPQYGLIAEEVAEVYPELVVNDDEGRPFAIRSQLLDPLLLNEVQKQSRRIEAQSAEIENLRAQLAKLEARLDGRSEP